MNQQVIDALENALFLLQDTMENHIYDSSMGEEPDEDCDYLQGCKQIEAALESLGVRIF